MRVKNKLASKPSFKSGGASEFLRKKRYHHGDFLAFSMQIVLNSMLCTFSLTVEMYLGNTEGKISVFEGSTK